MNNGTGNNRDSKVETRRRLLKAASAAPLIATLSPNSALALSSAAQCAAKLQDRGYSPHKVVKPGHAQDTAVRRTIMTYKRKSSAPSHWPGRIYEVGGNLYKSDGDMLTGHHWGSRIRNKYNPQHREVLEYFRASHEGAESIGPFPAKQPHQGTPLSGSCWTSINPDAWQSYT